MEIISQHTIQGNHVIKRSIDGTIKIRDILLDGVVVESCVLYLDCRNISNVICVSSQAGCHFNCRFCNNGFRSFIRNLTTDELLEQIYIANNFALKGLELPFDVTFMGTGEPLSILSTVREAINIMLDRFRMLSRINISTILPHLNLDLLMDKELKGRIHIQLSLHSPFEEERCMLFGTKLPSIDHSIECIKHFGREMNDRPCLNYLLFDGINDTVAHAIALADLVYNSCIYIKLSTYSPVEYSCLRPTRDYTKNAFTSILKERGIMVKTFKSRGLDVRAGCGQLISEMI